MLVLYELMPTLANSAYFHSQLILVIEEVRFLVVFLPEMSLPFTSRRSPVICSHGCVASSQPLASEAGLQILRRGGNAADAAVAVAAALNVTEPCSTGIGGDCFCLYFDAGTKKVHGINGRCVYSIMASLK